MYADLFGDFLDHHWFQSLFAPFEKLLLATDNHLACADDCVLSLLDIPQQLNRRLVALLHVIPYVLLSTLLAHHLAIGVAEAQRRHVILVHDHHVLTVTFYESDVGFDQAGLCCVIALARPGVQRSNELHRRLYLIRAPSAALGQLSAIPLL